MAAAKRTARRRAAGTGAALRPAALLAASSIALCAALVAAPRAQSGISLPDGPGVDLVYARCRTCHDLQYLVDSAGLLPRQWDAVLQSMHDYGLKLGDAERSEILDYLTKYLGPNPPPAPRTAQGEAAGGKASAGAARVDGHAVYERNCSSCHGADARGQPTRVPPLAGNDDLRRDPLLPVLVILHGIDGPIEVEGARFDASMPAFDHLSDAQIAAVVNYLRNAGDGHEVTPSTVAGQRSRDLSPDDVHAYRARAQ